MLPLLLLLSCGSGSTKMEDPKTTFLTSIANLGKGFLDVFTSLSDMVAGAFGIKAETKKSDIGKYFTSIENTMNTVKKKLQDQVATNGNYLKVKEVVEHFITNTLDKIAEGAREAAKGAEGNDPIGNVAAAGANNAGGTGGDVISLINGIKTIVEVVLKGKGNAEAGDSNKSDDGVVGAARGNNAGEVGKLFGNDDTGAAADAKKSAVDAVKAVGAVTGADILQSMVKEGGDAAKLAKHNAAANTIGNIDAKDAVIAGGIALRAMAKGGKFANGNAANDIATAVKGAAASAVTKALDTLTIAIRNTIDTGLKTISEALAAVKQEDNKSSDSTIPAETATGSQQ
ncbi:variable large family protein (plasmid) [Borrelia puertoricensis]|uniref:variable large family protein n=1 Tax=Borrelia puertoricensis TaxID=2756107 RepID=UPI003EBEA6F1